MKVLKNSLLICLTVLFISCTSDDSTTIVTDVQKDDLLGTWNLAEITQEGSTTTDFEGVPITVNFSSFGKNLNAQVTFSENPDNFVSSGSYTAVLSYTIIGQSTTEETQVNLDDFLNTGAWQLDNGMLTVTQNNETQTASITEITSNSLKFEIDLEEEVEFGGFTSTATGTAKMTLTR